MEQEYKIQKPITDGNWLYRQELEMRFFSKLIYLPLNAPLWEECTNEEKEQWEHEHPQPEPEPEPNE